MFIILKYQSNHCILLGSVYIRNADFWLITQIFETGSGSVCYFSLQKNLGTNKNCIFATCWRSYHHCIIEFFTCIFQPGVHFHLSRNNMLRMFKGDKSFFPECFRASQFMVVSCVMYNVYCGLSRLSYSMSFTMIVLYSYKTS